MYVSLVLLPCQWLNEHPRENTWVNPPGIPFSRTVCRRSKRQTRMCNTTTATEVMEAISKRPGFVSVTGPSWSSLWPRFLPGYRIFIIRVLSHVAFLATLRAPRETGTRRLCYTMTNQNRSSVTTVLCSRQICNWLVVKWQMKSIITWYWYWYRESTSGNSNLTHSYSVPVENLARCRYYLFQ